MKFEDYYIKSLNEMNLSGGVLGPGSVSSGSGAHVGPAQDTYAKGDSRKPEVLGSKKKKRKKKLPKKLGETGSPEMGPVQTRNMPELMAPRTMKGINENEHVHQEFVQALLPAAAKVGSLAARGAVAAGKTIAPAARAALKGSKQALKNVGTAAAQMIAPSDPGPQPDHQIQGTEAQPSMTTQEKNMLKNQVMGMFQNVPPADLQTMIGDITAELNKFKTEVMKKTTLGAQGQM